MTDDDRTADREPSLRGTGGEAQTGRSFTTHPTGDTLAKDLHEVRSKPERAFNVGAALGLTLAVATFIFLVQNAGPTDFEWLWLDFQLPLWAALVGALATGALLVLTALAVHRRRRRRIGRRDRAAGRLEQALTGEEAERGTAAPANAEGADREASPPAEPRLARGGDAAPPDAPRRPAGPGQVRGPMQG